MNVGEIEKNVKKSRNPAVISQIRIAAIFVPLFPSKVKVRFSPALLSHNPASNPLHSTCLGFIMTLAWMFNWSHGQIGSEMLYSADCPRIITNWVNFITRLQRWFGYGWF